VVAVLLLGEGCRLPAARVAAGLLRGRPAKADVAAVSSDPQQPASDGRQTPTATGTHGAVRVWRAAEQQNSEPPPPRFLIYDPADLAVSVPPPLFVPSVRPQQQHSTAPLIIM
jgi:hypothetical protein